MNGYKLSRHAKEDLKRIYFYGFKNYGEQSADIYYHAFFEAFEKIAKAPDLYPAVDHIRKGYRRCPCGADTVYYRVQDDIVEIMAIIGGQNTDVWL